jgi:hypothetical protein
MIVDEQFVRTEKHMDINFISAKVYPPRLDSRLVMRTFSNIDRHYRKLLLAFSAWLLLFLAVIRYGRSIVQDEQTDFPNTSITPRIVPSARTKYQND